MKNVLLVDDEKNFLESVKTILEEEDALQALTALSGKNALKVLKSEHVDLVVTDLKMPGMGGLELVAYMARHHPQIPVIIMTAYSSGELEENFRILGVSHLLEKPIDLDELQQKIRECLEATEPEENVSSAMKDIYEKNISQLATIVEIRDPHTAGHQQRVTNLALEIGRMMGMSESSLTGIKLAGQVHDIGKIAVPSEILTKPGKLTSAEILLIKSHPKVGYDLLKPIDFPWPVADIVIQHHEHRDGSGYPNGIDKDRIQEEAAVLTVADVVEAIANHRPYRPAKGVEIALQEIQGYKNKYYLPEAVDACVELFYKSGYRLESA